MKKKSLSSLFKTLLFCCVSVVGSFCYAQQDKLIEKTFDMDPQALIDIKNTFGKVHITSWDEPKVLVEVEILVRAGSDSRMEYLLDNIDVDFDRRDLRLSMTTQVDAKTRSNESFKVNYNLRIPRSHEMKIGNSFGDIFIDDRDEAVEVELSYGNLKAGEFKGGVELKVSFGKAEIESITKGKIYLRYCDFFSLKSAEKLDLDQQFSDIEILRVEEVSIDSKYGDLEVGDIKRIEGDIKFTNVDIDNLHRSLDLDCQYTSDFTIGKVTSTLENFQIEGDFGSYDIDLEDGLVCDFEATVEYADLRMYGVDIDYSLRLKEDKRSEYKGRIGNGNATAQISIYSKYGDIRVSQ